LAALRAQVLSPRVLRWISDFEAARVLHVFDRSANLVNDRGEVVSIVDPEIGPGPFNLVLKESFGFMGRISPASEIGVGTVNLKVGGEGTLRFGSEGTLRIGGAGTLRVGTTVIALGEAVIWNPVPPWRTLGPESRDFLIETIGKAMAVSPVQPAIPFDPPPDPGDTQALASYAGGLAGLGPGLTPSGDDVLMGWVHALFVLHPPEEARASAVVIAGSAAPRTTTLSAAWLYAAAAGEAGGLWHLLVESARTGDEPGLRDAITRILATGHTSGADALAGFAAGLSHESV
jgi:hypothetical protein